MQKTLFGRALSVAHDMATEDSGEEAVNRTVMVERGLQVQRQRPRWWWKLSMICL